MNIEDVVKEIFDVIIIIFLDFDNGISYVEVLEFVKKFGFKENV